MNRPAGALVTDSGETFIPASQRPDGTWRKARRIKGGYVPQEEVPLYESKGKQFANRIQKAQNATEAAPTAHRIIPGLFVLDKKAEEPPKFIPKAKPKNDTNAKCVDQIVKKLQSVKIPAVADKSSEKLGEGDPAKKIRNLRKRLREIDALEDRMKSGDLVKPEKEQLEKIKRKNDILMEIHVLEKRLQKP